MLAIYVLLGLVASSFASSCCTSEDRAQVQDVWSAVWSAGLSGRRVTLAQAVFSAIFEAAPSTRALFAGVGVDDMNSAAFRAHCIRVVNALDVSIALLDNPGVLNHELSHLGAQHTPRNVDASAFGVMADAFSSVMPQVSSCFVPDAWTNCFNRITSGIIAGM